MGVYNFCETLAPKYKHCIIILSESVILSKQCPAQVSFMFNTWGWASWDVAPWPAVGPAIVMVRPSEWSLNPRIYYWRTTRARPAVDTTATARDLKYFSYLILRDCAGERRRGVCPVSGSVQTVQWWNSTRPSPGQVWPAAVLQCCSGATCAAHTRRHATPPPPHTSWLNWQFDTVTITTIYKNNCV